MNLGFNALLNFNIKTVKLDSFKRKTHKRDKKIILLWFENPNRFLNFSHFTKEKRKEEPNEKSVASGILTQLSENPIIETLENRFLDCVNNHFMAQLIYANWKMIDFSVWSLCHTKIKSVWLDFCAVEAAVAAVSICVMCKSNSSIESNFIIFNWNCWTSLSLLYTRTINTMNKHQSICKTEIMWGSEKRERSNKCITI